MVLKYWQSVTVGVLFALASTVLTSCGDLSSGDQKSDPPNRSGDGLAITREYPTYYGFVRGIVAEKCVGCHQPGGIGGFSLQSYDELKQRGSQVIASIQSGRMPPWLADSGHMAYADDLSLSQDEKEVVARWWNQGGQEGHPDQYKAPERKRFHADQKANLFSHDQSYLPRHDMADDYRCFVLPDSELSKSRPNPSYLTGFITYPGPPEIVHHVVVYHVTPEALTLFNDFDAAEPGLGYQCFGGALPDSLGNSEVRLGWEKKHPGFLERIHQQHFWLAHWAPGMDGGMLFPPDTGVPIKSNGAFIVQIHYHTHHAGHSPIRDGKTALGFMWQDQVKKPAFYFPHTDSRWLSQDPSVNKMKIPAGGTLTVERGITLKDIADHGAEILHIPGYNNFEVLSANLHMHAIGKAGEVTLRTDDAGVQKQLLGAIDRKTLLSISNWDLRWQRDYMFKDPLVFAKEDLNSLTQNISCTFYNYRDFPVEGGYGSDDEMCFNFGLYAFSP